MKLVALVASLFPTSIIKCNINGLTRFSRGLLRLFFEIKQQGLKKRNKNNACLLVALVAPTGNAAANKRRPPVVANGDLRNIKTQRNRTEAIGQPSPDSLSEMIGLTFRGYLNADIFQSGVR